MQERVCRRSSACETCRRRVACGPGFFFEKGGIGEVGGTGVASGAGTTSDASSR
jgi:hypothetical protein